MSKIKANAIYNILNTALNLITPVITFPYLTRIINPDGLGKVSWAESITSIFVLIASFGIPTYGIREIAKHRNNAIKLEDTTKELFYITVMVSLIFTIVYVALIFTVFDTEKRLFLISALNVLFTPLWLTWFYQGIEEFAFITKRSFLLKIIILCSIFILVRAPEDYYMWTLIVTISNILGNLLFFIYLKKYICFTNYKLPALSKLKKHIKILPYFFFISLATTSLMVSDKIILGFITDTEEVGYYSVASKFVRLFESLILAIGTVLIPKITLLYGDKNFEEIQRITKKFISLLCFMAFPTILIVNLFAEQIIFYFAGDAFLKAIPTLQLLTPLFFILPINNFLGYQIIVASKLEKKLFQILIMSAFFNITLNFLFVYLFDSSGASLSCLLTSLFTFYHLNKSTKGLVNVKYVKWGGKYILGTSISSIFILFGLYMLSEDYKFNLFYFISLIVSVGLFYGLTLIILREKMILSELKNIIKRKL